jgi:tetratricopeptide (TPR) repeat protein
MAMLDGEIEYRRGKFKTAFENLRLTITRDDNLDYAEPWGWLLPTSHPSAAILLEQGHVEEAAKIYEEDLDLDATQTRANQHPNNVWALHGYHECLTRLQRSAEARIIKKQLTLAAAVADVPVESLCFCRLDAYQNSDSGCCKLG